MANTPPKFGDDLFTVYNNKRTNTAHHKSFDFSNVNSIAGKNDSEARNFRRFHQMTLFVDFGGLTTQGKTLPAGTYMVSANLPETIKYSIGSKWEAPLSVGANGMTNLLMQVGSKLVGGVADSGIHRVTSMKIWGGSAPLKLSLKIPVLDDGTNSNSTQSDNGAVTNLTQALEFLGCLCLPKYDSKDGGLGFYTPPPSPLNINFRYGSEKHQAFNFSAVNGRILLQLGSILLIDNCLIEGVEVEYPNTKAQIMHTYTTESVGNTIGGQFTHPLLAMVTITISTVEAMTAQGYSKMLWMQPQPGEGKLNSDVSKAAIKDTMSNAFNKGKEIAGDLRDAFGI
jgi:hypothetical protein